MSVILNEAAIVALIETEEGPVGRFVQQLAEEVVADAAKLANAYYHDFVDVGSDIGYAMIGSTAVIGYDPGPGSAARDHKAQRLADKEREGMQQPPLTTAVLRNRR